MIRESARRASEVELSGARGDDGGLRKRILGERTHETSNAAVAVGSSGAGWRADRRAGRRTGRGGPATRGPGCRGFGRAVATGGRDGAGKPLNVKEVCASAAPARISVISTRKLTCLDLVTEKIL